jgi:hypothetical protein
MGRGSGGKVQRGAEKKPQVLDMGSFRSAAQR